LSDPLESITKNLKVIVVAALAAFVIAAIIGVLVGLRGHRSGGETFEEMSIRTGLAVPEQDASGLLMPQPALPPIAENEEEDILYLDRHPEFIEEIEPVASTLSELIQHRGRGVQSDMKPFEFMGEELDILTYESEIAEP
jgi:hypothetical protein